MNRKLRSAVTLIEVIFSIGVVLIGLLGLLSIMPLAGRRSQEAVSLATAAALGDSVMNELLARRLIGRGELSDMQNATITSMNICIDPIYKGEQAPIAFGDFDDNFFPYYKEAHDPLLNPSDASTPSGTPAEWPVNRPALRRVGFNVSGGATSQGRREQGRILGENVNDLLGFRPKDRSLAPMLNGLKADGGHVLSYGKRVPSGEFTWIATVNELPGGRFASVSIVVLRNRNAVRDFPTSIVETDPLKNGVSERLAYVTNASGFTGGSGGTLLLAASQATLSKIQTNDWILLSSRVGFGAPTVDVHRWFRVVMVDGAPNQFETTHAVPDLDPMLQARVPTAVGSPVWTQRVVVDGPDWRFGFFNDDPANDPTGSPPPPPLTPAERFTDNTFATILSDVVSVTERVVKISDL